MPTTDGPAPTLRVTSRISGRTVVLKVVGEIDLLTSAQIEHAITGVLAGPPPSALVLDLTDVSFLDSAGLAVLAHGHMTAAGQDLAFRVVATNPSTLKPIRLTGLDGLLTLFDSVTAALAQE
jgi:anti-sigma B factor antagonist